ncbi:hypothetical protein DT73_11775 [Mangrovibacter sp. MFB070]|uniref:phage tail fiber protein n=1 Tax=Mangrovibacter sp. MFB070 TaxID=1224318 RepID=UPI0004D8AB24|nr:phage tail protein [Mangrovibacter sp. MFB070]KEA52765.1 hypothetical protein DT73_11775 [Mangrovibacter sp. MFB070]
MPAGTLTLTNNSNIAKGSGTSFSAEFASGDVLASTVGEVTYTLFIKSVDSDTQVTLVKNYDGPTAVGLAWSAIPRNVAIAIPAQIATEVSKALRGLNQDKSNWQQVFSSSGTITVTLPDGSSFSGPSWQYLSGTLSDINTTLSSINTTLSGKASKGNNSDITRLSGLTTALSVGQGGTGATNAEDARQNFGLGSAATATMQTTTTDNTPGRALSVGAFGLGTNTIETSLDDSTSHALYNGFYAKTGAYMPTIGLTADFGWLHINRGSRPTRVIQAYQSKRTFFSYSNGSSWTYHEAYTTGNTTKASDGTLSAASPVARVVQSQNICTRADIGEDSFEWCGAGTANEEARGITIARLDTGVYAISGSAGLASEGWQIKPPRSPEGTGDLGIVEHEVSTDNVITLRLYKVKYQLDSDTGEITRTPGIAIDVPENSWIDVRMDMPAD